MFRISLGGLTALTAVLMSTGTGTAQAPLQLTSHLNTTQTRISTQLLTNNQPAELVKQVLAKDRIVVQESAGPLTDAFRTAKYSIDETVRGIGSTWYSLRVGKGALPLTTPLSSGILQSKAKEMGRLFVTSQPDQATIFIDREQWGEPTNADTFPDVGQRIVRVQKAGLQPAETTCAIKRDVKSTFTATLLASGSTATCK